MSDNNTDSKQGEALLPCPFCGTDKPVLSNNQQHCWEVFCRKCGGSLMVPRPKQDYEAVAAWNSRASVAAPQGDTKAPATPTDAAMRAAREIASRPSRMPPTASLKRMKAAFELDCIEIAAIITRNLAGTASPEIPVGGEAQLHYPFSVRHENCAECDREYEPLPPGAVEAVGIGYYPVTGTGDDEDKSNYYWHGPREDKTE